jgi:hypothetical protein
MDYRTLFWEHTYHLAIGGASEALHCRLQSHRPGGVRVQQQRQLAHHVVHEHAPPVVALAGAVNQGANVNDDGYKPVWPSGMWVTASQGGETSEYTTAHITLHRGFLAIHFVLGQAVPVDEFIKVLRIHQGA